jgi:hypothetical protein
VRVNRKALPLFDIDGCPFSTTARLYRSIE